MAARLLADEFYGGKFVGVNASAISESFVETRMRGCKKGYHSEAKTEQEGWFEKAHNGVLFLDEFQACPEWVQIQLLDLVAATTDEVLVSRLGRENEPRRCTVKLLLAVNEDVDELRSSERFREDLFHRVRHRVSFRELREHFADDEASKRLRRNLTPKELLRVLLRIFRWKFAADDHVVANTLAREDSGDPKIKVLASGLFHDFAEDDLQALVSQRWQGNYRELELFAADVYAAIDRNRSSLGSVGPIVRQFLARTAERPRTTSIDSRPRLIAAIEDALKKADFSWKDATKELADLKIKDPRTLKRKIVENKDRLSPDFLANPKIRRLLE